MKNQESGLRTTEVNWLTIMDGFKTKKVMTEEK